MRPIVMLELDKSAQFKLPYWRGIVVAVPIACILLTLVIQPPNQLLWVAIGIGALGSATVAYAVHQFNRTLHDQEQQLTETHSLLQAIVRHGANALITVDRQGKIEGLNASAIRIFGYTASEVIGQDLSILLEPPADFERVNGLWQVKGLRKVGAPFPIEVAFYRLPRHQQTLAIVRDLSEVQQTQEKLWARANELARLSTVLASTNAALEDRNRELEQFAYVASHDLKAPLRAIASLSEWIEEDLAGQLPEENQQQMTLLRGRVLRMEALINGLLDYSRVGRVQAPLETVSVAALVAEVVDSITPPAAFQITIAPDLPTLKTQPLLLRQVFSNLIGNAIKHHDRSQGTVTISAVDQGREYEFAVTDDGPGIAPEHHEKIFTIFQTLQARDVRESTGIGLSIVKKIVESEGGTIRVESELGQGTTFYFSWLKQSRA